MKKIILNLLFFLAFLIVVPQQNVFAIVGAECKITTDCDAGETCIGLSGQKECRPNTNTPTNPTDNDIFGNIEAPQGVAQLNEQAGGIGLILFISNLIKLISIVAGVWTMFNFIFAGFTYITDTGNSGAIEKIGDKLTMSVTGLIIIAASYTVAGIIGLIIFGDATYIINPQIPTVI